MYFSDRREINPQAKFVPDFVIESLTTFELIKLENVGTVGLFKGYVSQILTWLYHFILEQILIEKEQINIARVRNRPGITILNSLDSLFEFLSLCLCVFLSDNAIKCIVLLKNKTERRDEHWTFIGGRERHQF